MPADGSGGLEPPPGAQPDQRNADPAPARAPALHDGRPDIFRSRDLSGRAKALWFLFVLLIPLIGVLVYLIVRGSSMHERSAQQAQQQDRELRAYVQEAAGPPTSTADQLAKLADLRDGGVITPEEFEREKAKIMA